MTRLRSPMKPIGSRTLRWQKWRAKNYELLRRRCRGVCEGCGKPNKLDVHHVIGRQDEPFSSHVACLAGLCRPCHEAVTGRVGTGIDLDLLRILLDRANSRMEFSLGFGTQALITPESPRDPRDWEYDPASNSIVRRSGC